MKLSADKLADWVVPILTAGILDAIVGLRRDLSELRTKVEVLSADVTNHEKDDDRQRQESERRREHWMGLRPRAGEPQNRDDARAR